MPVITNDIVESSTGSITVDIPNGQHDYMLILFAASGDVNNYSTPPTVNAPSGGGGTWTAVGNNSVGIGIASPSTKVWSSLYVWYSYPTSRGATTITLGSHSGDTRYSVAYSLSNAVYYSSEVSAEFETDQCFDSRSFSKQGSSLFAMAHCSSDLPVNLNTPMYDAVFGEQRYATLYSDERTVYGGWQSYQAQHRGQYIVNKFVIAGVDWSFETHCALIQLAVDTVECSM